MLEAIDDANGKLKEVLLLVPSSTYAELEQLYCNLYRKLKKNGVYKVYFLHDRGKGYKLDCLGDELVKGGDKIFAPDLLTKDGRVIGATNTAEILEKFRKRVGKNIGFRNWVRDEFIVVQRERETLLVDPDLVKTTIYPYRSFNDRFAAENVVGAMNRLLDQSPFCDRQFLVRTTDIAIAGGNVIRTTDEHGCSTAIFGNAIETDNRSDRWKGRAADILTNILECDRRIRPLLQVGGRQKVVDQPIGHLDLFITACGNDKDDYPILLFGNPKCTEKILGRSLDLAKEKQDQFDGYRSFLEAKGFKLVDIPLLYDPEYKFVSYNNTLMESYLDDTGCVRYRAYMPSYMTTTPFVQGRGYNLNEIAVLEEHLTVTLSNINTDIEWIEADYNTPMKERGSIRCMTQVLHRTSLKDVELGYECHY